LERNRVEIDGRIASSDGLRHTPGGLPSLQLRLGHASGQTEANRQRRVEFELEALAFGKPAQELAGLPVGTQIRLIGFLERKGIRDPWPIVHITEYELI
jgi:primosomal replication protein N